MQHPIVIKANDGRGMGHVCRVANYVAYAPLAPQAIIIVHDKYQGKVPEGVARKAVADHGFRVDLDQPQELLPGSIVHKFKGNDAESNITNAAAHYYEPLLPLLSKETRLFYLDDQNGMETLLLKDVGASLGRRWPDVRELMPSGNVAAEIETQFIESATRLRALQQADYIHLSCDWKLLRSVAPDFSLGDLDHKVISMGLPLGRATRHVFDAARPGREDLHETLLQRFYPGSRHLVYCTFGAGEGAEAVMGMLRGLAKDCDDTLFLITDPRKEVANEFARQGASTEEGEYGTRIDGRPNLWVRTDTSLHLQTIVAADAVLSGNGSGTTYENIYARTPMVCVPLVRPGYEQLLKGMAVAKSGGGELLLLDALHDDPRVVARLDANGINRYRLAPSSAASAIASVLRNRATHVEALARLDGLFGSEESIGEQVLMMARGVSPEEIRSRQEHP